MPYLLVTIALGLIALSFICGYLAGRSDKK